MHNAQAHFNAEELCARRGRRGGLGTKLRKCTESSQHLIALCWYYARLMLRITPILYCKRAALHHAPDTRPIDSWALPPVPLSSLAEPRLLVLGAPRRPRGYFTLKVSAMRLSVLLYYSRVPDRFSIIAHALDPGKTVWFKRLPLYNLTMCLAPPLFCARGVSRQRGNSLYTPL